jgi:hypothetical protein
MGKSGEFQRGLGLAKKKGEANKGFRAVAFILRRWWRGAFAPLAGRTG